MAKQKQHATTSRYFPYEQTSQQRYTATSDRETKQTTAEYSATKHKAAGNVKSFVKHFATQASQSIGGGHEQLAIF